MLSVQVNSSYGHLLHASENLTTVLTIVLLFLNEIMQSECLYNWNKFVFFFPHSHLLLAAIFHLAGALLLHFNSTYEYILIDIFYIFISIVIN